MLQITEEHEKRLRKKYAHLFLLKTEAHHASMLRAFAAAEALSDAVNEIGFDCESFGRSLAGDHRTLQQSSMRAFLAFVKELDVNHRHNFFDARNEAACKLASQIVKLDDSLPNI